MAGEGESVAAAPGARAHAAVLAQLRRGGAAYELLRHRPIRTVAEAERFVPELVGALIKTVVFAIPGPRRVLAAVRAGERIDYKALAAELGVNRRALRALSPEQVECSLGFAVGGVGPFALSAEDVVVFDAALAGGGRVYCGSGITTATVAVELDALARLSGARFAAIARRPPPATPAG